MLEKKKYSKKVTKEESTLIMAKCTSYNKTGSETTKSQIIKLLTPKTVEAKKKDEKKKIIEKAVSRRIKVETKKEGKKTSVKQVVLEQISKTVETEETPNLEVLAEKAKQIEEPKAQEGTSNAYRERYR